MKRLCAVLMIVALTVLIVIPVLATAGQPPVLSTTELVENSYKWDGKTV